MLEHTHYFWDPAVLGIRFAAQLDKVDLEGADFDLCSLEMFALRWVRSDLGHSSDCCFSGLGQQLGKSEAGEMRWRDVEVVRGKTEELRAYSELRYTDDSESCYLVTDPSASDSELERF
jgi:hypothetical protein